MLLRKFKFYNLIKKFIKIYKKELTNNEHGVDTFKLNDIFDVEMHLPMIEIYDVLDNVGVTRLIKKIYKLKQDDSYSVKINYIKSNVRKINYIHPQFNHTSTGILAEVNFLNDSLIKKIEIVWTQINNEEAIIVYEIYFKKWINELKDINEYVLKNINKLKVFSPTTIYRDDIFEKDEKETYNIVCNMFSALLQYTITKLFYSKLGRYHSLPLLNRYIVKEKNENIMNYLEKPFLEASYVRHKEEHENSDKYIIYAFDSTNREYNEFIFGNSYSPGSEFLYYFSEYRMEFYYQIFDYIEINILEHKMSKYLNSHKRNIKVSDYKWLIKKVRQLGEKRLYNSIRTDDRYNMEGFSEREIGKKFVNPNTYSEKFEAVYNDNLNYIKEMNNVDYNYKIYIITIITLALTIIGTFATFLDFNKEQNIVNNTLIENETSEIGNIGETTMSNNNYLSYEYQFKEILNQDEINRIENFELREVRMKYWNLRHNAFLDEYRIKDSELANVFDDLWIEEQRELEKFKNK